MREKKNVKDFRLPVSSGIKPDGFGEDVPLHDINNYVMLPDGSGIKPREGFEIRRNDAVGYGSDRKLIYFISNPPDIDYGDMIVIVNTKDDRNFIETTEVVRTTNTVSLENPMPMPDLPDMTIPYVTLRPFKLTSDDSIDVSLLLVDSTDYTGLSESLDWTGLPSFDDGVRASTTKNLMIVYPAPYYTGDVGVFDLQSIADNPSDTHAPVQTWAVGSGYLLGVWVDRENNMAMLTDPAPGDVTNITYRLYVGLATDAKPVSYTEIDVVAEFGAGFGGAADPATGTQRLENSLIVNGGWLTFLALDGSDKTVAGVKADGTGQRFTTAFPETTDTIRFLQTTNAGKLTQKLGITFASKGNASLTNAPVSYTTSDATNLTKDYIGLDGALSSDGTRALVFGAEKLNGYKILSVSPTFEVATVEAYSWITASDILGADFISGTTAAFYQTTDLAAGFNFFLVVVDTTTGDSTTHQIQDETGYPGFYLVNDVFGYQAIYSYALISDGE